jgi:hypothetical protein
VLETVWVGGRKVPLRRLSPDLKIRMRRAALEDYEAEGRSQWAALRAQAAERQARAGK